MAIKCDNDGIVAGTTDDRHITQEYLHKAVKYAVEHGAEVINISYSTSNKSKLTSLENEIKKAIEADVSVVCSVGNDGGTAVRYPAGFPNVIGVGATYKNGSLASYSNRSSAVDIVAPGGYTDNKNGAQIYSTTI